MIRQFSDLAVAPEPYADYRPIFETSRLNMTHVRIHPGATVPTHTHLSEDQVYYVATGTGFVVLDGKRTDVTEYRLQGRGALPLRRHRRFARRRRRVRQGRTVPGASAQARGDGPTRLN